MSLQSKISELATRIATEFQTVRSEISASASDSNVDGGRADEIYTTDQIIDGGNANG